ncbi:AAA family ATPase [Poritiphilus flavus]|uniref:AAA family ATPase n=1 Tax=Poritiphilus flavus TaxID=2697053 RepID=A0A6L9EI64_9FLAO|nr:AAA family ATPase [Poritiphilus flavus]NAS14345.1 AAA family ATPase [Poritiphilus flavus]
MKYLTPNFWNLFRDTEGKFIGKEFEKLVQDVLKLRFGGNWEQTPLSWDGGKDFVNLTYDGKSKSWAECKMYKKSLTTSDFAKTLVMAINNSIDSIIIISYSPLVKNARIHLGDFAAITHKNVQVFDDTKFENLIFSCFREKEFAKYFPDFEYKKPIDFTYSTYTYYNFVSSDITIEWSQINELPALQREIITKRNNPCLYELCFISNLTEEEHLTIDFSSLFNEKGQLDYRFNFVNLPAILSQNRRIRNTDLLKGILQNTKYERTLRPGQIFSLKLYFIPVDIGELKIPSFKFQFGGIQENFTSKKLIVSNLSAPPLIGGLIHETIHRTDQVISSNNRVVFQIVSGDSGVGKTRYAKEIIDRLLKYNFHVNLLDGATSNCETHAKFIVELLTQLYKLPNPYNFENKDVAFNVYEKDGFYSKPDELVYSTLKLCIQNQQIEPNLYENELIPLLHKLILSRRSALIIDNVQSLDEESIELLNKLMVLNQTIGQNFVMYIFNTEVMDYNSKPGSFYNQLHDKTLYKSSLVRIKSFKLSEVTLFVDSTIRLRNNRYFSKEHKNLFQQIVKSIPAKPFYLSQFIDLLLQDEVISLEEGDFYINNVVELNNRLISISRKETDILSARLSKLTQEQRQVLSVISFFGELDSMILKLLLDKNLEITNWLIEVNFLKKEYEKLKFVHSLMDGFFVGKVEEQRAYLTSETKNKFLKNEFLLKHFPHVLFTISPQISLFDNAVAKIDKLSELSKRNQFYANSILKFIYLSNEEVKPDQYLYAVIKVISFASFNDKKLFLIKLLEMWGYLKDYIPPDDIQAIFYIEIARECGSFFAVHGEHAKSILFLDEVIEKVKGFKGDNRIRDRLIARLTNRKGVSFKQAFDFDNSSKSLLLALDFSIQSGSIIEEYLTYIDLGYIYYGRDTERTKEYWKAVHRMSNQIEEKIFNSDPETGLACILIKSLYNGIIGEFENSIVLANKLIYQSRHHCSTYYELQGLRAKAFFEYKTDASMENLENQLNKLIHLSSKANLYKYHVFAFHLLAIVYERYGKYENAKRQYQHILEEIKNEEKFGRSLEICLLISDSMKYYNKNKFKYPLSSHEISLQCGNSKYPLRTLGIHSPFQEEEYCLSLA